VKPKAPHVPWGRKRIRGKSKTSQTPEATGPSNDAKPERRLVQGCFAGFDENSATAKEAKETVNEPGKVGRPMLPKREKRWKFISTRLTPEEYKEIADAIKASGEWKTEWVRKKLLAAARRA
jgi:hypothetical protein